jgi:hypothetical protein
MNRVKIAALGPALFIIVALLLPSAPAQAKTPITYYTARPGNIQAGGHPDVEIRFGIENRLAQVSQSACNCEDAKDATVHLPAGFIGDPHATPQCTIAEFSSDSCPIDSQIGIVSVLTPFAPFDAALYNLVPPPDVAGLTGFKTFIFDTPQFTVLSARTGSDYGLDARATSIYHGAFPLVSLQEDLWGVPADSRHDLLRLDESKVPGGAPSYLGALCDEHGAESTADPNTIYQPCDTNFIGISPVKSNSPPEPFLQAPTTCDSAQTSYLDILSYDGETTHAADTWPREVGCDQLSFNPSLYAQPTTTQTDSASGIDVNLTVPQQLSPTIPSPTELRGATVTLPTGFSINPNAADGKTACTDEQGHVGAFGDEAAAECPEFSKVGSLEIDSSALPGPLPGSVYLGQPEPGTPYRILLVADGFATHVKIAGTVHADPVTGQLVITFTDLPQTPLTAFDMHFFGSERGLLATPTKCGTYPVTSSFTPWDTALGSQTSQQFFTLTSGPGGAPCPGPARPFGPTFEAAAVGNTAGAHSPFSVKFNRADGDQFASGVTISTPPGFSATIAGIPYCPDAAIQTAAAASGTEEEATPSCPAASRIGSAEAGVGSGNHPLFVPGRVYLAGPYKGAPLSLVVITPALSGPYDLGDVVLRVALSIDPVTAQITASSDPLPQILEGIPLRLRSVRVNLNRPGFILNPTNCDPFSVGTEIFGTEGGSIERQAPFQIANCRSLPYGPKLTLNLTGGLKRRGHPAVHATFTTTPGEANTKHVAVALPKGELLDQGHIGTVCTRPQFAQQACPASSLLGTAEASSPLLAQPLKGNVYLRSNPSHELPDLVADLRGQINIELAGTIDTVKGGSLRTTFATVPDVPVTRFDLDLAGGAKGLLENNESLCGKVKKATTEMVGQNGAVVDTKTKLQSACSGKEARRKNRRQRRGSEIGRAGR